MPEDATSPGHGGPERHPAPTGRCSGRRGGRRTRGPPPRAARHASRGLRPQPRAPSGAGRRAGGGRREQPRETRSAPRSWHNLPGEATPRGTSLSPVRADGVAEEAAARQRHAGPGRPAPEGATARPWASWEHGDSSVLASECSGNSDVSAARARKWNAVST